MRSETSNGPRLSRNAPASAVINARLSARYLGGGFYWLAKLRWVACCGLFFAVWLASNVLGVVSNPVPLYLLGFFLTAFNIPFWIISRKKPRISEDLEVSLLFLQILADLMFLTLLLYFSGISHNPFIFYFVFHIIIAGILLPESYAYLMAALASVMVGAVLILQYWGFIPEYHLNIPYLQGGSAGKGIYIMGKFTALSSALVFAVYFTVSVLKNVRYAESKIRQKEKLFSLGQLVSGIVHQIKNPLDGLKNCLHHISNGPDSSGGRGGGNKFISLMYDELDRIERLTHHLQDFARPHGVELRSVDVNREIAAALKLLEIIAGSDVKIQQELGRVPKAYGDPFALQEVVINLCTNALSAMPEGGTLTVRTYLTPFRLNRGVDGVGIDVIDTGEGLSQEELKLIFEPFYSTKSSSDGTGLGLWICQMLVSQMGGIIEVTSAPGKGSTFKVILQPY
ncbi:MAG: ATP-binding protein [Gemmatimonadota bacterium]|nr:ATP-binding protein [Gemmatimonadota bacterium]